jgi:hypothetical protein
MKSHYINKELTIVHIYLQHSPAVWCNDHWCIVDPVYGVPMEEFIRAKKYIASLIGYK